MKKIFNLLALLLTIAITSYGQSQGNILPTEATDQCPETNITFTVTLPVVANGIPNVVPYTGNPVVVTNAVNVTSTSINTSFTFVGKFRDENITQVFRVNYKKASDNSDAVADFTFKKIKSFADYSPNSVVNPNPSSITSAICQLNTHNISFTNVTFGNGFDGQVAAYGSVNSYEYLLPSGWKLGATTSNGTTWITGGNNVTITSNLSGGDNQYIQIRALNTACGITLAKGPITSIPILRPKPSLTFTGGFTVCSSQNFQANSVPSWVTNFA